ELHRHVSQVLVLVDDFGIAGDGLFDRSSPIARRRRDADDDLVFFRSGLATGCRRRDTAQPREQCSGTDRFQERPSIWRGFLNHDPNEHLSRPELNLMKYNSKISLN